MGGIGSGADDVDKINIGHWFRLGEVCGRQQRKRGGWRVARQKTRQTKACLNIKRTIRYALKYASSRLSSISFVCLLGIVSLHFSRLQTHAHTHPYTHTHTLSHTSLFGELCV